VANVASGRYPLYTPIYLVTHADSPNAAQAKSFIDFTESAKGQAVLRKHHLLPYQDGTVLASMDSARRSRILAEVGARRVPTAPSQSTTPISAPGATYASRAASAPTSQRTLAAREALAERNARRDALATAAAAKTASTPKLADVHSSVVAAPEPSSLKGVRSDAVTVADTGSRGSDFARVRSDSYVSRDRPTSTHTRAHERATASAHVPTHKVAPGETLYSIAHKHHLDVAQIRDWNHLAGNTVHAGQVLRLSAR
jgi:phosphate transport system substrate-binding protein